MKKRAAIPIVIIFAAKLLFLAFTGSKGDPFPLDILLLVIITVTHPLSKALPYAAAVVVFNVVSDYLRGTLVPLNLLYDLASIFAVVGIVGWVLQGERNARVKAEGLKGGMESLAANISGKDGADPTPALSEAEKERIFLDSAGELNSSLEKKMETIVALTGAYSCCLFTPSGELFKLSSSVSPSKRLIYDVPRQKGKSLINWIEENARPLCMDRLPDFRALGYYSADEGVKHFLGVPVMTDDKRVRAVLSIDRRDVAFTKEDERILTLSAAAVSVFLENSSLIGRMRVEAREFSVFYSLAKKLGTTLKAEEILKISLDTSREIVDCDTAAIALKDDNGGLKFTAAGGSAYGFQDERDHNGSGFYEWVMGKGVPIQFLRSRMDRKVIGRLPKPLDRAGSFLCIPLIVNNVVMGEFITARKEDAPYTSYEVRLFEAMCAHVSSAVSNARIYGRMEELATKDGLTGLHNYRFFQERLSHEIERGSRYNQKLALILLDIDFFKKVNDTYGHPAGDRVLKGVASILAGSVREVDLAARYGGEEFAIILININVKDAHVIAERIRTTIEGSGFDIGDGSKLKVTSSMGIASYPGDGDNPRLLISMADSALYRAKKDGRNRVCLSEAAR